jgi:hypothetical protein
VHRATTVVAPEKLGALALLDRLTILVIRTFSLQGSDAAAVSAQRGRARYYLEGRSTGWVRYALEQTLFFFLRGGGHTGPRLVPVRQSESVANPDSRSET